MPHNGLVVAPIAPVCTTKVLEGLVSGTASPLTCGLELTRPSYEPKATWQGSKSNGGAMRIHPLGVLAATVGASPELVRRATAAALLPTHTHPEVQPSPSP